MQTCQFPAINITEFTHREVYWSLVINQCGELFITYPMQKVQQPIMFFSLIASIEQCFIQEWK
ncbi:hypothetical protein BDA96_03G325000 [Sorghum bicolor]|uniref:Uncharacterized protein n=2 Tax=Sorghum bicolor TaxID=4558 RepID=A0A921RGV3_SORBI|nr:hypothetical protein BDA96_03G325000 [Sorghum bicolor]OQU87577.1 hypothetical protein SORBI_3003G301050 [Sorghum bicolor]